MLPGRNFSEVQTSWGGDKECYLGENGSEAFFQEGFASGLFLAGNSPDRAGKPHKAVSDSPGCDRLLSAETFARLTQTTGNGVHQPGSLCHSEMELPCRAKTRATERLAEFAAPLAVVVTGRPFQTNHAAIKKRGASSLLKK
jgi:hypothetical protein